MFLRSRLLAIALLVAALARAGLPAADEIRCGVLGIERVFRDCQLIRARSDQLMADRQQAKVEIEAREQALNELKNELSILPQGHRRRPELEEKVQVEEVRFKLIADRRVRALQQLEARMMKDSYLEMRALLQEFAQARGYTLIFIKPSPELKSEQVQEIRLEIAMQPVVYHAGHHDITDDFVAFANGRAVPPPAVPEAGPAPAPDAPAPGFERRPTPEGP